MSSAPEPTQEPSKQVRLLALVILAAFIWSAFFTLILAGGLFFASMEKPNPAISPILWILSIVGTVSALCAAWLHHWIKNLKMKSITINL